jgi:hypothetical protein
MKLHQNQLSHSVSDRVAAILWFIEGRWSDFPWHILNTERKVTEQKRIVLPVNGRLSVELRSEWQFLELHVKMGPHAVGVVPCHLSV